jgi:hypothetical protein
MNIHRFKTSGFYTNKVTHLSLGGNSNMVGHYFLEEQGTYKSQHMTIAPRNVILYLSTKTPSCLRFSADSNSKRKPHQENSIRKKTNRDSHHRTITTAYQHVTPFVGPAPNSFFRSKLASTSSRSRPLLCMSIVKNNRLLYQNTAVFHACQQ